LPPPSAVAEGEPILTISHVSKTYRRFGLLQRNRRTTHALNDVSVSLTKGTTFGIVGESGSGKSTLARCIVRLIDPDAGVIRLGTDDLTAMSRRDLRAQSRRIQMVFQDPYGSLNPRRTAGELVTQELIFHGTPRAKAWAEAREMFAVVGLDSRAIDRYPHEFSAVSASASDLHARWRCVPTCWWRTNRFRHSMFPYRRKFFACWPICGSRSACR
jgi:peptide/nickel transport system ATP-binding protein